MQILITRRKLKVTRKSNSQKFQLKKKKINWRKIYLNLFPTSLYYSAIHCCKLQGVTMSPLFIRGFYLINKAGKVRNSKTNLIKGN